MACRQLWDRPILCVIGSPPHFYRERCRINSGSVASNIILTNCSSALRLTHDDLAGEPCIGICVSVWSRPVYNVVSFIVRISHSMPYETTLYTGFYEPGCSALSSQRPRSDLHRGQRFGRVRPPFVYHFCSPPSIYLRQVNSHVEPRRDVGPFCDLLHVFYTFLHIGKHVFTFPRYPVRR
jgi:hypothetical protein